MLKVVHVSDVNIKLQKQHKEYEIIFSNLYEKIHEEDPDIICLTGDILHNKLTLSPEAVQMTADFLKKLADIKPLYMIAR